MRAIPNCKEGLSKSNMTAISAPYNFVPLPNKVHIPEWSRQVSHDWPFEDGYSGEIHYRLIAESPILVGDKQEKNSATDRPNTEVKPFQLPDGTYAIPGSSLKGVLRSVVEIAGFGRMRMVDDVRPGLRDISGKYVSDSYTGKVRGKVKTGFMRMKARGGGREIVPCSMARLHHRALEEALGISAPIFKARLNVHAKYEHWASLCQRKGWNAEQITFDAGEKGANSLGKGAKRGFPVFTGQISDSTTKNGKKKDFIFYDPDDNRVIDVPDDVWRDFLAIHGDDQDNSDMSWPGHWKQKFRSAEPVPVFYLQDGGALRIGLAYMPKLAGDFSTHDIIRHANEQHLQEPGVEQGYDLADLLFGAINSDEQNSALRGRVSCELARADGNPEPEQQPDTILNGPKPSYFPNYLDQDAKDGKLMGRDPQYTTYIGATRGKKPVARGFKRYPSRGSEMVGVQQLSSNQVSNKKVQVRLHPLPAGTVFEGRVVFHNLKPEELGALLWVMTWGGDDGLRHGIGMGKPFGFGQVRFELDFDKSQLIPNTPDSETTALDQARVEGITSNFVSHMDAFAKANLGCEWRQSPQILNLMAVADPSSADDLPYGMDLRHMCLDSKKRVNEFVWAKQEALVLAGYQNASGWPTEQTKDRRLQKEREGLTDQVADASLHPWLQAQLGEILGDSKATDIDGLMQHGKLFKAWQAVDEVDLKRAVFVEIKAYWEEHGWWENPSTKSTRQLKAKYERAEKKL